MEVEVQESQSAIEDGLHQGTIEKIEYRNIMDSKDPNKVLYTYADIFIKEEKTEVQLKYGTPVRITEKTKLGKLLQNFTELMIGHKIDPEKVLLGKKVKFMTITERTPDGEFARIVDGSIKPIN